MGAFSVWLRCFMFVAVVVGAIHNSSAATQQAPLVEITAPQIEFETFPLEYYVAPDPTTPLAKIKTERFTPYQSKLALGTDAKTTWVRFRLRNATQQQQRAFVHFPEAYHNRSVAFFKMSQQQLVDQVQIDLDNLGDTPYMIRDQAVYDVVLAPQETVTLYIQSVSFSHQWFSLQIYDEHHSRQALASSQTDIAVMIGILLALIVFNFLLYFSSRSLENVYYSLYLISGAVWIALSYGLLANAFGMYGTFALHFHLSLLSMPLFLIFFMIAIFETKQHYPTEHRVLRLLSLLIAADLVYGFFDVVGALRHASSLAGLMIILTLSVGLSLWRKGHPLAKFFVFGHVFFFIFNAVAVLYYKAILDFSYITKHGVGIGIMLEALMLAFIVAYRIKMLEQVKAGQEQLRIEAQTDALTKLHNRRYFSQRAQELLARARAKQLPLSVITIDIDHFKQVNDEHGHHVGDQVIVQLAELLRSSTRSQDVVARFGGEEFVLLLYRTSLDEATQIAEHIRYRFKAMPSQLNAEQELVVTLSAGVAQVDLNASSIELALQEADAALYEAKHRGRDQVQVAKAQLQNERLSTV